MRSLLQFVLWIAISVGGLFLTVALDSFHILSGTGGGQFIFLGAPIVSGIYLWMANSSKDKSFVNKAFEEYEKKTGTLDSKDFASGSCGIGLDIKNRNIVVADADAKFVVVINKSELRSSSLTYGGQRPSPPPCINLVTSNIHRPIIRINFDSLGERNTKAEEVFARLEAAGFIQRT